MDGYPKVMYPKIGGGTALVHTPEQEKNLGADWQTFPAHSEPAPAPKRKAKQEMEAA
jgi:hypothetical protein